jgi:thioredoxin reductase (NADPH)
MFSGDPLAVVGGGDSAAEEAVYLTKYSPEIHLLVRGGSMRASRALQDRVLANRKISVHYNTRVVDVSGDDPEVPFLKSPVTAVQVATTEGKTEVMKNLAVRGLFYAIGHDPNTALFAQFLDVDEKGYVRVAPGTPTTSLSGVFAAGDVQDPHWRQAVTAAGSGCMAALAAERYLSGEGLLREVHQPKDDVERKKGAGGRGGEKAVQEPREKQTEATAIPSDSNSGSGSGGGSGTGMRSLAAATEDDATDTYHKGEAALQSLLASSGKPILIMFMSKTCGPCRILKPILGRVLKVRGPRTTRPCGLRSWAQACSRCPLPVFSFPAIPAQCSAFFSDYSFSQISPWSYPSHHLSLSTFPPHFVPPCLSCSRGQFSPLSWRRPCSTPPLPTHIPTGI